MFLIFYIISLFTFDVSLKYFLASHFNFLAYYLLNFFQISFCGILKVLFVLNVSIFPISIFIVLCSTFFGNFQHLCTYHSVTLQYFVSTLRLDLFYDSWQSCFYLYEIIKNYTIIYIYSYEEQASNCTMKSHNKYL